MSKTLEERLAGHSNAFDGLLSLIPAKYYYDEDSTDQWAKKKQTKQEKNKSKRAKLDPEAIVTALDVKKDREAEAEVLAIEQEEDDDDEVEVEVEVEEQQVETSTENESESQQNNKQKIKGNFKSEKVNLKSDKANLKSDKVNSKSDKEKVNKKTAKKLHTNGIAEIEHSLTQPIDISVDNELSEEELITFDDDGNALTSSPPPKNITEEANSQELSSETQTSAHKKSKNTDKIEQLRERLAAKVKELREKRKAPGTGVVGAPSSRDAILAARQQKKRKRDDTSKTREDKTEDTEDDVVAATDDNSDSEVLFNAVQFKDGRKTTADLKSIAEEKKRKKRDLVGELRHVEAKKAKIAFLDADKRARIEEKGQWSRAILQAEGSKLRDNEKMLKKSIKQQQKKKMKSEREWQERKETVANGIAKKQAKRENNLQMRKDMKGVKGKAQRAKMSKKLRAGFEGKKR